jgi:hypothetical protein
MVAAQVVVAFEKTPRDRQARDDAAFHAFRFVARKHGRRSGDTARDADGSDVPHLSVWCQAFQARRTPLASVEVFEQTDERVLTGFHRRGTEAEREHERPFDEREIDLARDGDVAVLGAQYRSGVSRLLAAEFCHPSRTPTNPADRASHGVEEAPARMVPRSANSIGVPLYSPTQAVLPLARLARWGARST